MPRQSPRAFTLVELLVVIAIVVLLITILLPVMGKARESARLVTCQSNQRQMFIASVMYADDSKDMLPDRRTLGGHPFRVAPGQKSHPDDPWGLPEVYGLAATLDRGDYMDGNVDAWVCPAQPLDWMVASGNTYFFATGAAFETTTYTEFSQQQTVWVRDNYLALPGTSGFAYPGSFAGPGFLIADQVPPHQIGGFSGPRSGTVVLYTSGEAVFEPNK